MPYLRKKGLSEAVVTGLIYLSAVATSATDGNKLPVQNGIHS